MSAVSERTADTIATLHPEVQERFTAFAIEANALAETRGLRYVAICGTRSWEEQARIYAQGRTAPGKIITKAPPGSSFHNFGLAVDFGVFRDKKYLDGSDPKTASAMHKAAGELAKEHGLRWGGHFRSIVDEPHFELDTPLSLSQLRDRKKVGEWVSLA
jgi:peptidoglycan L-alanyl-D-glutamate endopeptidase CwlK